MEEADGVLGEGRQLVVRRLATREEEEVIKGEACGWGRRALGACAREEVLKVLLSGKNG